MGASLRKARHDSVFELPIDRPPLPPPAAEERTPEPPGAATFVPIARAAPVADVFGEGGRIAKGDEDYDMKDALRDVLLCPLAGLLGRLGGRLGACAKPSGI